MAWFSEDAMRNQGASEWQIQQAREIQAAAAQRAAAAAHAQAMDIQDRAQRQAAFDKMFGFLSPGGGYSSSSIEGMGFPGIEKRISNLLDDPTSIKDSGAYKFRFGQGQEALERSLGAKGLLQSGNRLTELTKYGQEMGTQEYDSQFNRLAKLLGGYQQERASMFGNLAGSLGGWVGGTAPSWNAWSSTHNAAQNRSATDLSTMINRKKPYLTQGSGAEYYSFG